MAGKKNPIKLFVYSDADLHRYVRIKSAILNISMSDFMESVLKDYQAKDADFNKELTPTESGTEERAHVA